MSPLTPLLVVLPMWGQVYSVKKGGVTLDKLPQRDRGCGQVKEYSMRLAQVYLAKYGARLWRGEPSVLGGVVAGQVYSVR